MQQWGDKFMGVFFALNLLTEFTLCRAVTLCLTSQSHQVFGTQICSTWSVVEQEKTKERWERTRDILREVQMDFSRPIFIELGKAKSQWSNRIWCRDCPCRLTQAGQSEQAGSKCANISPSNHTLKSRGGMMQCASFAAICLQEVEVILAE